eukprot:TRINITY_DN1577_c0_g1_i1.p3 TRINITY_DN1577_c0_g1~~TRINITY_DN1577_c0_g1_i1.p3  ORF type:complete len:64 (-),score=0.89 TRINITY_DN1577_c0_g1_i1:112-303(-)
MVSENLNFFLANVVGMSSGQRKNICSLGKHVMATIVPASVALICVMLFVNTRGAIICQIISCK